MIEFKNVSKVFSKGVKAVDNISFTIEEGEIFGFLGPNGAGKSTSLKMMVGILEQTEGKITVNGVDTLENSIEVKEMISYVPDNPDIYTKMTGIKYLNFIADIYGIDEKVRKEKIEEYNQKLELGDAIYSTIDSYSHGMRQKLVLIGALITSPKVLILDEPMVGLDVKTSFNLKNILRDDISEDFVDSLDVVLEITNYGIEHNCKGHTYAIKYDEKYIGFILLWEAIEWSTDPEIMKKEPFYRLMAFIIDKRYRGCGIGSYILEKVILNSLRLGDIVCKYSMKQFLILLDCDENGVVKAINRIKKDFLAQDKYERVSIDYSYAAIAVAKMHIDDEDILKLQ